MGENILKLRTKAIISIEENDDVRVIKVKVYCRSQLKFNTMTIERPVSEKIKIKRDYTYFASEDVWGKIDINNESL